MGEGGGGGWVGINRGWQEGRGGKGRGQCWVAPLHTRTKQAFSRTCCMRKSALGTHKRCMRSHRNAANHGTNDDAVTELS